MYVVVNYLNEILMTNIKRYNINYALSFSLELHQFIIISNCPPFQLRRIKIFSFIN